MPRKGPGGVSGPAVRDGRCTMRKPDVLPVSRLRRTLSAIVPPPAAAAAILACGLTTAALVLHEREQVQSANQARFDSAADDVREALVTRLRDFEQVLRGAQGFVHGSQYIDRDEWRRYATSLRLDREVSGITGLALVQRVASEDVPTFEATVRAEYLPEFRVHVTKTPRDARPTAAASTRRMTTTAPTPAPGRELYVIRYHEPLERNRTAVGFDIASNPASTSAQVRARDCGEVSLTGRTRLLQDQSDAPRPGLIMYAPLYKGGVEPATVEARREALSGYVGTPVLAEALIGPAVGHNLSRTLRVSIRDEADANPLWRSDENPDEAGPAMGLSGERHVDYGGRRWVVSFAARPAFVVGGEAPLRAGAGAAACSLLLVALTWTLSIMRSRSADQAERMSRRAGAMEARFEAAFHGSGAGMGLLDAAGRWVSANDALCRLLGSRNCALGTAGLRAAVHREDRRPLVASLRRLRRGDDRHAHVEARFVRPDGREVWGQVSLSGVGFDAPDGYAEAGYFVIQVQDVTAHKALAAQLRHAATHDALTGLATRPMLVEALRRRAASGGRRAVDRGAAAGYAVLFFDLDGFKPVNDRFGHDVGDKLLRGVADRLRAQLRGGKGQDLAARVGGDEFVVLLGEVSGEAQATAAAERLVRALAQPYAVAGQEVRIGASVGVSTSFDADRETDDDVAEAMLRRADGAMYARKRAGRGERRAAA